MTRGTVIGLLAMLVWSAPAQAQNISDTWQFAVELDVGGGRPTFVFTQDGETLSGTYQGTFDAADVSGTIQGDRVEFSFELQGSTATYTGTVDNNTMSGTCDYVGIGSGVWEAERAVGE
jgi:hypothetical protein